MIRGFHLVWTAYGWWFPNDPRGSWSSWVGSWDLYRYGPATKVNTTQSLAHQPHDRQKRLNAKEVLKYPPVRFTGIQARAIGTGFARAIQEHGFKYLACAIMPDHVHVVLSPHGMNPGQALGKLKRLAGDALVDQNLHPMQRFARKNARPPLCFARRGWKVYLDTPDAVMRSIHYVEQNPVKEGLPLQRWQFVEKPRF